MDNPFLVAALYSVGAMFVWYCWATLARRLGYRSPGWIGFAMLIPVVGLFVMLYLIFNESPNEQRLRGIDPYDPAVREGASASANRESEPQPEPVAELSPNKCPACNAAITVQSARCPDCGIALR
jgi:hypothetical protein